LLRREDIISTQPPQPATREVFISVDIEAAGPIPAEYSLLSIGAAVVGRLDQNFYIELKPINANVFAKAMQVNQLSLAELQTRGIEPRAAMQQFAEWIKEVAGADGVPVFVGFNAAFDWSFVNYYFHKFLGANPFGHAALDIKSYYMAVMQTDWAGTRSSAMNPRFLSADKPHTHNALGDAIEQGAIFEKLLRATHGGEEQ
jgi:DNA polymerase III epsilon subunit-like protein